MIYLHYMLPIAYGWLNAAVMLFITYFWLWSLREPNAYKARTLFNFAKWAAFIWVGITGTVTVIWLSLDWIASNIAYIIKPYIT